MIRKTADVEFTAVHNCTYLVDLNTESPRLRANKKNCTSSICTPPLGSLKNANVFDSPRGKRSTVESGKTEPEGTRGC